MPGVSEMPMIGYGTWKRRGDEAVARVRDALATGYRHIDTAQAYGNEAEVGEALEAGDVPRDEIWVTTKIMHEDFKRDISGLIETSLKRLRTDHLDLLLAHWPSPGDEVAMEDYLGAMADAREAGLTRHVGVSNFTNAQVDRAQGILGADGVYTNQVECHVHFQNRKVVDHCQHKGIRVTAYSPIGQGSVPNDATLTEIARAHDATAAQVALAFLIAEGIVAIPTSSSPERIAENFGARDVSLSEEEVARIRDLDTGRRLIDPSWAPDWD